MATDSNTPDTPGDRIVHTVHYRRKKTTPKPEKKACRRSGFRPKRMISLLTFLLILSVILHLKQNHEIKTLQAIITQERATHMQETEFLLSSNEETAKKHFDMQKLYHESQRNRTVQKEQVNEVQKDCSVIDDSVKFVKHTIEMTADFVNTAAEKISEKADGIKWSKHTKTATDALKKSSEEVKKVGWGLLDKATAFIKTTAATVSEKAKKVDWNKPVDFAKTTFKSVSNKIQKVTFSDSKAQTAKKENDQQRHKHGHRGRQEYWRTRNL